MKISDNLKIGLVALFVLVSDQGSKLAAREMGWAQMNQAGVFGLFPEWNWDLITLIVLLGLLVYILFFNQTQNYEKYGWVFVLMAGLSNIVDRFIWGGVWDWIRYPVLNVVGNWADVLISLGLVMIFYQHFFLNKKTEAKIK